MSVRSQTLEALEWLVSEAAPSDPDEAKREIIRRWGWSVWSEVLGISLAFVIRDNTERLLKEHP